MDSRQKRETGGCRRISRLRSGIGIGDSEEVRFVEVKEVDKKYSGPGGERGVVRKRRDQYEVTLRPWELYTVCLDCGIRSRQTVEEQEL